MKELYQISYRGGFPCLQTFIYDRETEHTIYAAENGSDYVRAFRKDRARKLCETVDEAVADFAGLLDWIEQQELTKKSIIENDLARIQKLRRSLGTMKAEFQSGNDVFYVDDDEIDALMGIVNA